MTHPSPAPGAHAVQWLPTPSSLHSVVAQDVPRGTRSSPGAISFVRAVAYALQEGEVDDPFDY